MKCCLQAVITKCLYLTGNFHSFLADNLLLWLCCRNQDFQEVTVELPGLPALRFAFAYGFRNIQNIVPKVKRGKLPYDFVEVMACPSGRHTVCIKYESEFKAFICATASVTFFGN